MVPVTAGGKLISALFLMLGVLVVSLPVPFIEGKLLHQQHLHLTEDRLEARLKAMLVLKNRRFHSHHSRWSIKHRGTFSETMIT